MNKQLRAAAMPFLAMGGDRVVHIDHWAMWVPMHMALVAV